MKALREEHPFTVGLNNVYTSCMALTKLRKWGNGTGVLIPKSVLDGIGVEYGQTMSVIVHDGAIVLSPVSADNPKYPSIDEVLSGWSGEYCAPHDFPARGREIDFGEPVGNEVW